MSSTDDYMMNCHSVHWQSHKLKSGNISEMAHDKHGFYRHTQEVTIAAPSISINVDNLD